MSRGRKPKSLNGILNWQQLFDKNVGSYFKIICIGLGRTEYNHKEAASELLLKINAERNRLLKGKKELTEIQLNEIPFSIPKNWVWCRLGDVITMIYGNSLTVAQCKENGKYPVYGSNGVVGQYDEYLTDKRAIIIGRKGSAGALNICTTPSWTTDVAYYVEENEYLNFDFIFYLLKSLGLESLGKGIKPGLNRNESYEIPIALPSFSEQTKISNFLNDFANEELKSGDYFSHEVEQIIINLHKSQLTNTKISSELTHQLDLVKQLRQAFLREAMQGKLGPQDKQDEPASELLKKIKAEKEQLIKEKKIKKEKELPPIKSEEIPFEIPENWEWCRLGEICNYGSSPKAGPKNLQKDTWVLDLEDIEKETSKLLMKIRFSERDSLSTKNVFKKGEVLYSKLRPYLDKVIVADENGVCTTEILPLTLFGKLNPYFIRYSLKRSDFLKYVNSVTKGMKMPRLGTPEGRMALVPLPSLSEQHRIVAKLEQLMHYCDELEQSIKQSQTQNEQLLQQVLREALQPTSAKASVGKPKKEYEIKDELSLAAEE